MSVQNKARNQKIIAIFREKVIDILLDWDKTQFVGSLFLIILLIILPVLIKSPYYLNILIMTALYAFLGLAWNIIGGFAGQFFMGFCSFFGVGAYTTIILLNTYGVSPWIGIPLAAIPASMVGGLYAFIALRYGLKKDYLALFTLASMVILGIVASQLDITHGAMGMWISFKEDSLINMTFLHKEPYLYIAIGLLIFGVLVHYKVYRSKTGRYMVAVREDEDAAAALGVNTSQIKSFGVILCAALAGIGGGFYAVYTTYIQPFLVFSYSQNVEFIAAPVIGGRGSIIGPLLGAFVNKPLVEIIRGTFAAETNGTSVLIYGLFLIIFIRFLPNGIAGLLNKPYDSFRRKLLRRLQKKE